ncbi:MAG: NAD(P)H-hydrate dehydratase [Euryarchaeota archaeon]|nr:NAD(P)H-hydrate dehydratase [Euryarchaeota archaeon]
MEPWTMHIAEVGVFDANAAALDIQTIDLMEAAGQALATETSRITETLEGAEHREIWVLCGPGNNGGDGFAASIALQEMGHLVRIIATHVLQKSDAAEYHRQRCREAGIKIDVWPLVPHESKPRLLVDALLGSGTYGGKPRGDVAAVLDWIRPHLDNVSTVACDIPTGFGTSEMIPAVSTVTFHAEKIGMRAADGSFHSGLGRLCVAPLPWPDEVMDCGPGDALRFPPMDIDARKGDRGRLLIIGGGPYHGAPILSGDAAARSGCDLVHVAMPKESRSRVEWPPHLIPESIPDEVTLTMSSVEHLIGRVLSGRGVQAIVIGPGLGKGEETIRAVQRLLYIAAEGDVPVVIDADAISALPKGAWPRKLRGIATPHAKEAEAWIGQEIASIRPYLDVENDVEGRVVIVTGSVDRLIGPFGRGCLATGGHPRMATGGTGDLLAGLCGGLLAQGMEPWPAARLACALLRAAGEEAVSSKGPGLVAGDVPVHIAETLAKWI